MNNQQQREIEDEVYWSLKAAPLSDIERYQESLRIERLRLDAKIAGASRAQGEAIDRYADETKKR